MTARVLVVDDVPANVKLLEARLSAEYFDVVTAMSGSEALAICEKAECDIVLLDVMMPDMDGPAMFRLLQRQETSPAIPVIFMTAKVQAVDREKLMQLGARGFIPKPFDPLKLGQQIKDVLSWQ